MRLLHTSDWHLGRTFGGASLLEEQSAAIERILEIVTDSAVEVVILAGDLYDRAIPPAEAVGVFDEALARLRAAGTVVVAIAGNHDSAIRVGAHDRILTAAGVTIRGDVSRAAEPVVITPAAGGSPVAVYPIPFLDPSPASRVLASGTDESSRRADHDAVTRLAMDRVRADLATRGEVRSVVVAHTFVTGSATCESERALTVGNIETVDIDVFAGFDYVALGHLHGAQERGGARVAYSGSPLAYSFSEEDHEKSVRLVDLAPDGGVTAEVVPLGVGRALHTLQGELEALLTDAALAPAEHARVRAFLTDEHLPVQAMARLRERFPHAVELRHLPNGRADQGPSGSDDGVRDPKGSPRELALGFWEDQEGRAASDAEAKLLAEALAAAGREVDR